MNLLSHKINLIFFLLIFLIFSYFHENVLAASNWNKYPNNPIISSSKNPPWFHTHNPSVIQKNGTYFMLFEGNSGSGSRVSKAVSTNGIDNWSVSSQPIIPTGQWDIEHANPRQIYNPTLDIYQAWFSAYNTSNWISGPDRFRVAYATSSAGIDWQKYTEKWALVGDSGKWDEGGIARGLSILLLNNTYHLWYAATNTQNLGTNPYWRIGYATSPDGINWAKYSGNPVIYKTKDWEYANMMVPFVLFEDGKFKMWYGTGAGDSCTRYAYAESTNGYDWTKPADKNPVYNITGVSGDFDKAALGGLSIIREGDIYKIWYAGYDGTHASIGYATASAEISTIPTPTPLEPVIIIPGMMTSWNKEGVLEGQTSPTTPWKLLPFVKEYDGLVQTLKNLGYQDGKNLFLWPYDWRKPVYTLSQNLGLYIESVVKPLNPGSKIHFVGHSLGGLITRAWTQTGTNSNQVHHLVTVAAPHKGTIQPYKPWEGGDVAQENSFLSLGARIIIELNRRSFSTTRQAVQSQFPALKDLLPTEPYLKRQTDGSFINQGDMSVWNTWLANLNTNASSIYPVLNTIKGTGFPQTPYSYTIIAPAWYDTVLGNWQDGKPMSQENTDGDTLIPASRAGLDDPSVSLSHNHSDLIASSNAVKHILQTLEIPASDPAIVSGQATTIQPGLLFLLRSPATLQVKLNGQTYTDFNGIIFIPGAQNGTYEATVTGTGTGVYHLAVGQVAHGSFTWKEYVGNISQGQQTTYTIPFSQTTPLEDPASNLSDKQRLEEIDVQLIELSKLSSHSSIQKARFDLKMGVNAFSRKDFFTLKKQLEQILLDLSTLRKSNPSDSVRLKTFTVADTLIDAYQAIFSKKIYVIGAAALSRLQIFCNNEEARLNTVLENKSKAGENITEKTQTYMEGKTYKERAGKTTSAEIAKKYILLFQTQILFREIGL